MPSFTPSRYCIRTSGRRVFRRCVRKWNYQSSLRMNLQNVGTEQNIHFWFGSGIHFALEDFFGYNKFGDPRAAFKAYYEAFENDPNADLPAGATEHYDLGISMLTYFLQWYPKNNIKQFQTLWLDEDNQAVMPGTPNSHPAVEEAFILDLGKRVWVREDTGTIVCDDVSKLDDLFMKTIHPTKKVLAYYFIDNPDGLEISGEQRIFMREQPIYYHGTIDRIVVDAQGNWWLWDWKTAKAIDTDKLDLDDQVSAYCWAAEQWFQHPIKGFVYLQMVKNVAKEPKRLKNGSLSTDKRQITTAAKIEKEILKDYDSVEEAPEKIQELLQHFKDTELESGDRFINMSLIPRGTGQKKSTFHHILGEVSLMCNPTLPIFPNPTRDCSWDCPFKEACILEEQGNVEEAKKWLHENFEPRPHEENGEVDPWRVNINWPEQPVDLDIDVNYHTPGGDPEQILKIILPE